MNNRLLRGDVPLTVNHYRGSFLFDEGWQQRGLAGTYEDILEEMRCASEWMEVNEGNLTRETRDKSGAFRREVLERAGWKLWWCTAHVTGSDISRIVPGLRPPQRVDYWNLTGPGVVVEPGIGIRQSMSQPEPKDAAAVLRIGRVVDGFVNSKGDFVGTAIVGAFVTEGHLVPSTGRWPHLLTEETTGVMISTNEHNPTRDSRFDLHISVRRPVTGNDVQTVPFSPVSPLDVLTVVTAQMGRVLRMGA